MFSIYGIALLSAATLSFMDAEADRVRYSHCLTDFTATHLKQKTTSSAFRKAAKGTCADKRSTMIAAMKKDEIEFGSSAAEATTYATEEADGVLFSFTDAYADFLSTRTSPVKESR